MFVNILSPLRYSLWELLQIWQVENGYRYEQSGATDYRVKIREYVTANIETQNWITEEITKSEVANSTIHTGNLVVHAISNDNHHSANSGFNFSLMTFEWDWYATDKELNCNCSCENTSTVEVDGQRKYFGEFYDVRCGRNSISI